MKTAVVASHHLLQYLEVSGWFPVQFIPFLRLSADFTSPLWVTAAWQRKRQTAGTEQSIKGQKKINNKVGKEAIRWREWGKKGVTYPAPPPREALQGAGGAGTQNLPSPGGAAVQDCSTTEQSSESAKCLNKAGLPWG